jgi:Lon protease-like protein
MYILPLFPLHTVLFPGMPLELHIFEPRYQLMMRRCLDHNQPFGVVLIHAGQEALGALPEPMRVGCTARIAEMTPLEEGRMNLTALGDDRFKIHRLIYDLPYLMGEVEELPLERPQSLNIVRGVRRLRPWVKDYLHLVSQVDYEGLNLTGLDLPDDPLVLLYLAAALLQVPASEKQPLLEAPSASELLDATARLYRRENSLLRHMLRQPQDAPRQAAWLN